MFGNVIVLDSISVDIYWIHILQVLNLALHIVFKEDLQPRLVGAQLDLILRAESFGEFKEVFEVLDVVGDDQSVIYLSNSGYR